LDGYLVEVKAYVLAVKLENVKGAQRVASTALLLAASLVLRT
jgi:hypothetical protein